MIAETNVEKRIKEWESLPELKCNHCGEVFKGGHDCSYEKLKEDNGRLREALEFYADEGKYQPYVDGKWVPVIVVLEDNGSLARQTLAGVTNGQR